MIQTNAWHLMFVLLPLKLASGKLLFGWVGCFMSSCLGAMMPLLFQATCNHAQPHTQVKQTPAQFYSETQVRAQDPRPKEDMLDYKIIVVIDVLGLKIEVCEVTGW